MAYQLINDTTILRLNDNTFIPVEEANSDYAEYLNWRKNKRNKPLPPPQPAAPPALTPQQKLEAAGLTLEDLRALVSGLVGEAPAQAVETTMAEPQSTAAEAVAVERPPAQSLGQEWIDQGGIRWVVVQAREANGQFAGDDPATAEHENLEWVRAADSRDEAAAAAGG